MARMDRSPEAFVQFALADLYAYLQALETSLRGIAEVIQRVKENAQNGERPSRAQTESPGSSG